MYQFTYVEYLHYLLIYFLLLVKLLLYISNILIDLNFGGVRQLKTH